jgi:hypothetical protein
MNGVIGIGSLNFNDFFQGCTLSAASLMAVNMELLLEIQTTVFSLALGLGA